MSTRQASENECLGVHVQGSGKWQCKQIKFGDQQHTDSTEISRN